jgi:two-component sensor histidine kinase
VKYGALKRQGAMLHVAWSTYGGEDGKRGVRLTWTEKGVPALAISPSRQGFGTELICEALPYQYGAETQLTFVGGGARCVIALPLEEEGPPF